MLHYLPPSQSLSFFVSAVLFCSPHCFYFKYIHVTSSEFHFNFFALWNGGKCWEWVESFSFCNQQTSPTSVCFHNPSAAAVTHTHRENYSTALLTHIIRYAQAQTYTQPSPAGQSACGNNHNFNRLLLDTIISLSWRMFPFEHFSILSKLDKAWACWTLVCQSKENWDAFLWNWNGVQ